MPRRGTCPAYVSLDEAAEMMSLSTRALRRRLSDGTIPAYQCGRRAIRLRLDELEARSAASPRQVGDEPRLQALHCAHKDTHGAVGTEGRVTSCGAGRMAPAPQDVTRSRALLCAASRKRPQLPECVSSSCARRTLTEAEWGRQDVASRSSAPSPRTG